MSSVAQAMSIEMTGAVAQVVLVDGGQGKLLYFPSMPSRLHPVPVSRRAVA